MLIIPWSSSLNHLLIIICCHHLSIICCSSSVDHVLVSNPLVLLLWELAGRLTWFCSQDSAILGQDHQVNCHIFSWYLLIIIWGSFVDYLLLPWKFISRTDEMRSSDNLEDKVPIDIIIWRMLTFSEICSNSGIFGLIGHLLELGGK